MAKITEEQVAAIYNLTTNVQSGTPAMIAETLTKNYGMSVVSAQYYVTALQAMLSGREYQRTINEYATRYFLDNIFNDFGPAALALAMASVRKHLNYYPSVGKTSLPSIKRVVDEFEILARRPTVESLNEIQEEFLSNVATFLAATNQEREFAISRGSNLPNKREVLVTVYDRNPAVAAQVLIRAQGVCERCKKPAPFISKKRGTPFLEVHHVEQLAKGGEDTIGNTLAVCPNCHREVHFGL